MAKTATVADVKEGLASLAGGWEGSEELVVLATETRRSLPREAPIPELASALAEARLGDRDSKSGN